MKLVRSDRIPRDFKVAAGALAPPRAPLPAGPGLRVPLPPLSEERRKELIKVVHKLAEEGRVGVRHARTDAIARIKKLEHVSEDDKHRADKDIQKLHDDAIQQIDGLVKGKEQEIMEV